MESTTKETTYYKAVFGTQVGEHESIINEAEFNDPETAKRTMDPAYEDGAIHFYEIYRVTVTRKEELIERV